jgi:hypothetical protein
LFSILTTLLEVIDFCLLLSPFLSGQRTYLAVKEELFQTKALLYCDKQRSTFSFTVLFYITPSHFFPFSSDSLSPFSRSVYILCFLSLYFYTALKTLTS